MARSIPVPKDGDPAQAGRNFLDELQPFGTLFSGDKRQSSDIDEDGDGKADYIERYADDFKAPYSLAYPRARERCPMRS
jgi:hypothetical protein